MRRFFIASLLLSCFTCFAATKPISTKENINKDTTNVATPSADGYTLPKIETTSSFVKNSFTFDRLNRSFIVQSVDLTTHNEKMQLNSTQKNGITLYPAIILLHAGNQTSEQVWNQSTLPKFAKENGYFLIAPDAYEKQWNDGKIIPLPGEKISQVDDVGFLMVLIDNITNTYPIDPKKVFIVGVSNGGFMATHLVCKSDNLIRAGANISSTLLLRDYQQCNAKNMPWLSFNGGNDSLVPFEGKRTPTDKNGRKQELLMSAEETFNFFNSKNRCLQQDSYAQIPHLNANDRTSAYIKVASRCFGNTKNVLLAFKNAGHQWPHNPLNTHPFNGLASQDIDPGTAIITFFNNVINPKSN